MAIKETKAAPAQLKAESVDWLRIILPKGSKVYGVVKKVAASGMSRRILFAAPRSTAGEIDIVNISRWIAYALDLKWNDDDTVKVHGCGMDPIFHVAYLLGQVLHGDGYALKHEHL